MVNMTLSIPDELSERMKQFGEIKWTHIARAAIEQRVHDLEAMEKIASKSKLTKSDAQDIAKSIKRNASKRFLNA